MNDMEAVFEFLRKRRDYYVTEKMKCTDDPVLRSYFAGKVEGMGEAMNIFQGDF